MKSGHMTLIYLFSRPKHLQSLFGSLEMYEWLYNIYILVYLHDKMQVFYMFDSAVCFENEFILNKCAHIVYI